MMSLLVFLEIADIRFAREVNNDTKILKRGALKGQSEGLVGRDRNLLFPYWSLKLIRYDFRNFGNFGGKARRTINSSKSPRPSHPTRPPSF